MSEIVRQSLVATPCRGDSWCVWVRPTPSRLVEHVFASEEEARDFAQQQAIEPGWATPQVFQRIDHRPL